MATNRQLCLKKYKLKKHAFIHETTLMLKLIIHQQSNI